MAFALWRWRAERLLTRFCATRCLTAVPQLWDLHIEKFAYQLIEYEHKTIEFLPNSLFSGNNANPNLLSESEAKNLRYSRHCAFVELLQKLLLSVIYFFAHYKREEGTGVGRTLSFKMHRLSSAHVSTIVPEHDLLTNLQTRVSWVGVRAIKWECISRSHVSNLNQDVYTLSLKRATCSLPQGQMALSIF